MELINSAKNMVILIFIIGIIMTITGLILGTLTNSLADSLPPTYTGNNTKDSLNDSSEFVVNPAINNSNLTVVSIQNFGDQFQTVGTIAGVALIIIVIGGGFFVLAKREGFF